MQHYIGLDVSLKQTAVCAVDRAGKIIREGMIASDPDVIAQFVAAHALHAARIGLETGATSTWLWTGLNKRGSRSPANLPSSCTGCGSTASNSAGQRQNLHPRQADQTQEFPPQGGKRRPCRDVAMARPSKAAARPIRAKRASHIGPPKSPNATMRRASSRTRREPWTR